MIADPLGLIVHDTPGGEVRYWKQRGTGCSLDKKDAYLYRKSEFDTFTTPAIRFICLSGKRNLLLCLQS
jgi:hypothetical protein